MIINKCLVEKNLNLYLKICIISALVLHWIIKSSTVESFSSDDIKKLKSKAIKNLDNHENSDDAKGLEYNKVEVMIGDKLVDVKDLPFNPFTGFRNIK